MATLEPAVDTSSSTGAQEADEHLLLLEVDSTSRTVAILLEVRRPCGRRHRRKTSGRRPSAARARRTPGDHGTTWSVVRRITGVGGESGRARPTASRRRCVPRSGPAPPPDARRSVSTTSLTARFSRRRVDARSTSRATPRARPTSWSDSDRSRLVVGRDDDRGLLGESDSSWDVPCSRCSSPAPRRRRRTGRHLPDRGRGAGPGSRSCRRRSGTLIR